MSEPSETSCSFEIFTRISAYYVTHAIFLLLNSILTVTTNSLLIMTIIKSPTLNTNPNGFLTSLCTNNLLLGGCALIELGLILSVANSALAARWLSVLQNTGVYFCLLNYWFTFAATGFYRSAVIQRPHMTIIARTQLIKRSLIGVWCVTTLLACLFGSVYLLYPCVIDTGMEKIIFSIYSTNKVESENCSTTPLHICALSVGVLTLGGLLVACLTVLVTYYRILRKQHIVTCSGNRIMPLNTNLCEGDSPSDRSPNTPMWLIVKSADSLQNYTLQPVGETSPNHLGLPEITDVQRGSIASMVSRDLKPVVPLVRSGGKDSFTDLQVASDPSKTLTSRRFSLKMIARKMNSATKNLLVMLVIFVLCSSLLIFGAIPGVSQLGKCQQNASFRIVARAFFYLNGPSYPMWYLLFAKKVRKVLAKSLKQTQARLG